MIKITRPTLLLDQDKCLRNIKIMAAKCKSSDVRFQPHFKTHQSHFVGQMYRNVGVEAITVSSIGMARYFANDNWQDITIAFPCNIHEVGVLNELSKSGVKLTILIDNEDILEMLDERLESVAEVLIELDTGYGRTGIAWDKNTHISSLEAKIEAASCLNFKGFYVHAGHSYYSNGKDEIKQVLSLSMKRIAHIKAHFPEAFICYGDTPTCSIADSFENANSVSAGNFAFYDLTQVQIGSCNESQIAIAMACPVVSVNNIRNEVCIYGGGIHFSKDVMQYENNKCYGRVVHLNDSGWSDTVYGCYISSLSQEHGIVKLSETEIEKIKVGDTIGILPVHSCMTAEAMGGYVTFDGQTVDHYAQKNRN